jgi:hypothetical protein
VVFALRLLEHFLLVADGLRHHLLLHACTSWIQGGDRCVFARARSGP